MLTGAYPMSVDAKGRVTLPAVFRKQLVDETNKTILLVPFDGCVNGFTREGFKAWVDGLFEYGDHHFDPRNRKDVMLKRGLMGSAVEIDIDSAGRVALGKLDAVKADTREKYGLVGDVTVVGADDHFEVWSTEKWNEQQADFEMDLESLLYHD